MKNNKGFTLVEIVVSVGIMAIIGVFLAATIQSMSRQNANTTILRRDIHTLNERLITGTTGTGKTFEYTVEGYTFSYNVTSIEETTENGTSLRRFE